MDVVSGGQRVVGAVAENAGTIAAGLAGFIFGFKVGEWNESDHSRAYGQVDIDCMEALQNLYNAAYHKKSNYFNLITKKTYKYPHYDLSLQDAINKLLEKSRDVECTGIDYPLLPVLRAIANLFGSILKQQRDGVTGALAAAWRGSAIREDGSVVMFFIEFAEWALQTNLNSLNKEQVIECIDQRLSFLENVKETVINRADNGAYRTPNSVICNMFDVLKELRNHAVNDLRSISFRDQIKHLNSDLQAITWSAMSMIYVSCDAAKKDFEPNMLMMLPAPNNGETTQENSFIISEYSRVRQTKIGELLYSACELMGITSKICRGEAVFSLDMLHQHYPPKVNSRNLGLLNYINTDHEAIFNEIKVIIRLVLELHCLRMELRNCISLAERMGDGWIYFNTGAKAATQALLLHIDLCSKQLHAKSKTFSKYVYGCVKTHVRDNGLVANDVEVSFIKNAVKRFVDEGAVSVPLLSNIKKRLVEINKAIDENVDPQIYYNETKDLHLCYLRNVLLFNNHRRESDGANSFESYNQAIGEEIERHAAPIDEVSLSVGASSETAPARMLSGMLVENLAPSTESAVTSHQANDLVKVELGLLKKVQYIMEDEYYLATPDEEIKRVFHLHEVPYEPGDSRWQSAVFKEVSRQVVEANMDWVRKNYNFTRAFICHRDRFENFFKRLNIAIHFIERKHISDIERVAIEHYLVTKVRMEYDDCNFFSWTFRNKPNIQSPTQIAIHRCDNGALAFRLGDSEAEVMGMRVDVVDKIIDYDGYKTKYEEEKVKNEKLDNKLKEQETTNMVNQRDIEELKQKNATHKRKIKELESYVSRLERCLDRLKDRFRVVDATTNNRVNQGDMPPLRR